MRETTIIAAAVVLILIVALALAVDFLPQELNAASRRLGQSRNRSPDS